MITAFEVLQQLLAKERRLYLKMRRNGKRLEDRIVVLEKLLGLNGHPRDRWEPKQ